MLIFHVFPIVIFVLFRCVLCQEVTDDDSQSFPIKRYAHLSRDEAFESLRERYGLTEEQLNELIKRATDRIDVDDENAFADGAEGEPALEGGRDQSDELPTDETENGCEEPSGPATFVEDQNRAENTPVRMDEGWEAEEERGEDLDFENVPFSESTSDECDEIEENEPIKKRRLNVKKHHRRSKSKPSWRKKKYRNKDENEEDCNYSSPNDDNQDANINYDDSMDSTNLRSKNVRNRKTPAFADYEYIDDYSDLAELIPSKSILEGAKRLRLAAKKSQSEKSAKKDSDVTSSSKLGSNDNKTMTVHKEILNSPTTVPTSATVAQAFTSANPVESAGVDSSKKSESKAKKVDNVNSANPLLRSAVQRPVNNHKRESQLDAQDYDKSIFPRKTSNDDRILLFVDPRLKTEIPIESIIEKAMSSEGNNQQLGLTNDRLTRGENQLQYLPVEYNNRIIPLMNVGQYSPQYLQQFKSYPLEIDGNVSD